MLIKRREQIGLHARHLLSAGLLIAGLLLAWLLGNPTLAWQVRVGLFGALILALLFLAAGEASLRLHLYFLLLLLAFGWRTTRIGGVVIDAQQPVAWLLLLHLLILHTARPIGGRLRGKALILIPLVVGSLGLVNVVVQHRVNIYALNDLVTFLLCVPVIFALRNLVTTQAEYRRVELVLAVAILLMTVPGIVEYIQAYAARDAGRVHVRYVANYVAFIGAQFSLWGGSVIGYALTPVVLIVMGALFAHDATGWRRGLLGAAFLVGSLAILLAGQRGAWIGYAVGGGAYAFVRRRGRLLVMMGIVLGWLLLPQGVRAALLALLNPSLESGYYDPSALGRYLRIQGALQIVRTHPWFGRGWAGSGWVHSDILQLAANVGVPATLLLFSLWLYPFGRLLALTRWEPLQIWKQTPFEDSRAAALVAAMIASLVLLATEALIVIAALSLPVWILFGLGWAQYMQMED